MDRSYTQNIFCFGKNHAKTELGVLTIPYTTYDLVSSSYLPCFLTFSVLM